MKKISVLKRAQHRVEYLVFRAVEISVRTLPEKALNIGSRLLAFLFFTVLRYRRDVALSNLAQAFPEKSSGERLAIAHASYRHFALMILEFMRLASLSRETLARRVKFDQPELIEKLAGSPRGVIVVSGHFGNWELALAMLASHHWKAGSVIQARQSNRLIDRRTADMRRRWGVSVIHSRGAVTRGLAALSRRDFLALLGDQDGGRRGEFVPFLGRLASTPKGAAILMLRSKAPLVFGCCLREPNGNYKTSVIPIKYQGEYRVTDKNIAAVTAEFTARLEEKVREFPEQYLWMHRRWKTLPLDS